MAWRHALWRRVIEAKYGNVWGCWCTKNVTSAYSDSLQRFIRSGWLNFSKLLQYDVGDGTKVKFWKPVWCGDCTLQKAFPKLYCISRARESSLAKVMCWSAGRVHWNVQFCQSPQDWEQEPFNLFMDMVYSLTVRRIGPNKVCWKPTRSRSFEVRGFYLSLYPTTLLSFPWRMMWQSKIPPRVAFFSWFASLDKILTTDNLRKTEYSCS